MAEPRTALPQPLKREVYVEAGHRCAIPTCRATSGLEVHHIIEWAEAREHKFDNLILLCANCHSRVTRGEIDRQAVKAYKTNLSLMTGRYGDLEKRVLERFIRSPELSELVIDRGHKLLLDYLLIDGIIEDAGPADGAYRFGGVAEETHGADFFGPSRWVLTDAGRRLIEHLRRAEPIT